MKRCDPRTVILADKSTVVAQYLGDVIMPFDNFDIRLKRALHIPGLGYNLVSVGRLADNGICSFFKSKDVELIRGTSRETVGSGYRDPVTLLYDLLDPKPNVVFKALVTEICTSDLWHRRLGHMNSRNLAEVYKFTDDVPRVKKSSTVRRACRLGKAHKLPFKGKLERAKNVGMLSIRISSDR